MKSRLSRRMAALAGLVAVVTLGTPGPARMPDKETRSIDTPEATFERYRSLINRHDFGLLEKEVIGSDPRFIFAGDSHSGLAAARAAFERTWATIPDEVYTMEEAEWVARDRASALVSFRYRYRGTMADGRILMGGGYGSNLFRRADAGWRLVYEHLSPDPVLNPAPVRKPANQ